MSITAKTLTRLSEEGPYFNSLPDEPPQVAWVLRGLGVVGIVPMQGLEDQPRVAEAMAQFRDVASRYSSVLDYPEEGDEDQPEVVVYRRAERAALRAVVEDLSDLDLSDFLTYAPPWFGPADPTTLQVLRHPEAGETLLTLTAAGMPLEEAKRAALALARA